MEKLRETVIKLASANLNEPLSSSQIALIDQRLHESFPLGLRVPSHPTYSTMVMNAITELSQEGGSSEDSISEHIKANHDDLPWAHKSILSDQLNRLCDEEHILLIASDRYTIPGFTPKRVFKRGKVNGKQVGVKRRVICPENSEEHGVQPQGSLSGKEELKFGFQENKEFVGLDSGDGIKDESVTNECRSLVVVEDKEEKKGQEEDQESEVFEKGEELDKQNSLITKLSIPETVKFRRRKNKIKRDQLLTGRTEKESLVDECQDKTSNEILALEDYSSGDEWMNNGASVESLVKKKKKDVENPVVDRVIVCAIGTKLPNPKESGRRVTRQSKKLTLSPVSKFPSFKLQKDDIRQEASILSGQETKSNWPSWVPSLLKIDFNGKCKIHANVEKSICNLYCADCKDGALCTSCVTSHEGHHVIKIKQADFEQLVDVSDIDKYIDIKDIRTIKESSTVTTIVLKKLCTWKNAAKNNSTCLFCKSRVPYPNKFCTLSCKFQHEHKVG